MPIWARKRGRPLAAPSVVEPLPDLLPEGHAGELARPGVLLRDLLEDGGRTALRAEDLGRLGPVVHQNVTDLLGLLAGEEILELPVPLARGSGLPLLGLLLLLVPFPNEIHLGHSASLLQVYKLNYIILFI